MILTWSVVVQSASIINRKGPELDLKLTRPMKEGMLHHGVYLLGTGVIGLFGKSPILVVPDNGGNF
jgi:hypothetical protein